MVGEFVVKESGHRLQNLEELGWIYGGKGSWHRKGKWEAGGGPPFS